MNDAQSTRRKFLQLLGLTAGATIVSTGALANNDVACENELTAVAFDAEALGM